MLRERTEEGKKLFSVEQNERFAFPGTAWEKQTEEGRGKHFPPRKLDFDLKCTTKGSEKDHLILLSVALNQT